jgi:hypothetical protein
MRTREKDLITQIELGALDSAVPLADTLRKVIVLGGQAGSTELRDWASRELRGYDGETELPEYRKPVATIHVNAISGNYRITHQRIDPSELPDFVAEQVAEEVPLGQGIGEIEGLLEQARAKGGSVHMSLPMGAAVTRYMNLENANAGMRFQHIDALYWSLSESAIKGVLERVRSTLTELVAEMRSAMPDSDDTPSAAVVEQAVNVAVHGKRSRVTVTAAQASGSGSHDVMANGSDPVAVSGGSPWRKIGAGIGAVTAVLGLLIALAQWQSWGV